MNDSGITYCNPIWYRGYRIFHSHNHFHDFAFVHDDYDGADDSNDVRFGNCATVEECKREIDEIEEVLAEETKANRAANSQFGVGA